MSTPEQDRITRELLERASEGFKKRMQTVVYAKHETAPQDKLLRKMVVFLEVLKTL